MRLLKNAIIMPLIGSMDKYTGGIYTSSGEFIKDSVTYRGYAPEQKDPYEILKGSYIYGGSLFGHFGHFIWESLSRLSTIRKCTPEYPILFISPNDTIYNMQRIFFKSIGLRNRIHIIKNTVQCENLIYDSPKSSVSPVFISDEQLNALCSFNFDENKKDKLKKIWLSRSKLPDDKLRKVVNEVKIEQSLLKSGFHILHPEKLSLIEQTRIISSADVVAGFDGSQFFSILFSKNVYGKFYVFNSRPVIPNTLPYAFQRKGVDHSLNTFRITDVGNSEWKISHKYYAEESDKILDILSKA